MKSRLLGAFLRGTRVTQLGAACVAGQIAMVGPAQAAIITFIDDLAGWEAQIGGIGSITGTEDFNSFGTDVSGHNATINLPLFSITSSSTNSSLNKIDVPPYSNAQADQNNTPSFLGFQNVTIDFTQNLTALGFGYLDAGAISSQSYSLQVNLVGGGSSTFALGNPNPEIFIGLVADAGMQIDSITWVLPPNPSPFSVDNFRLVAVPIPPALYLFGGGILGLVTVARRRKQIHQGGTEQW